MLTELTIRDLALIAELRLELPPGLLVLSGETGAGKSLVVGGLRLLCGERAGADVVRKGASRGFVEAVFEVDPSGWIAAALEELDVSAPDGEVIVRREVARAGRSRARVNGCTVPLSTLTRVSELLVDLHGQHDHQSLLRPAFQLQVMDEFAGAEAARERFATGLASWKTTAAELDRREASAREEGGRRELARFQLRELEEADPEAGELDRLKAELLRLESAASLRETAGRLVRSLAEADGSVGDVCGEAAQQASRAAERDPRWAEAARGLESLAIAARELARDARSLGDSYDEDPARLEAARDRRRTLEDLLRKYGPGEEELLATRERLREEAEDPEAFERRLELLREQVKREADGLMASGAKLTRSRRRAAGRLSRTVERTLAELGMEGARFQVRVEPRTQGAPLREGGEERAGPSGLDAVELELAANAGEELKPLRAVASGGEMCRIMLALKSALGETRGTATMVFDEIDAGVGGSVAARVGERLTALAKGRQVICITHLAAIASRADAHFRVAKERDGRRTVSIVEAVEGEDRVREIARMLGGEEAGVALEHARELLSGARPGAVGGVRES